MADFDKIVRDVMVAEGVKFNADRSGLDLTAKNPRGEVTDQGGFTAFGLSTNANPDLDLHNLTLDQAIAAYKDRYWLPHQLNTQSDPWAHFLFDAYVQHNPKAVEPWRKFNAIADAFWARMQFYVHLSNFPRSGAGWIQRMINLRTLMARDYGVLR